jgi:DNA-directed RNA polymerase subunit RPC12/RpoP
MFLRVLLFILPTLDIDIMGLFTNKCPKCGCKMIVKSGVLYYYWSCPNCSENRAIKERLKDLEQEVKRLKSNGNTI